ncbi:CCA tRNA nucleotidyltransferase [Pararhizobium sp.]|uniref:CCA tRNA nucleotidyltransferase n=1 Tax=Pararhizobium sp. TaxID=1977563 RepID=UPI002717FFF2|nr:CCA tRNA nucleotidyltransferase [Pararhizobium sp.]MDO9414824.1 CCA tRNA nucleotidyltransferase [Pararhizobium sp.]
MTSVAAEPWFSASPLQRIFALLNADGGEVRVVGGAVRNSLMGLPVSDIDMATVLVPSEVVARAKAAGIKSVPTGIAHGTVTLVLEGTPFEVTTLRRDVATDGRHAEVAFGTDWKADAERRDFTINALYAGADGLVADHTGGLKDIESRTIRFIGDAAQRIEEDHLRILRFFRFFAHYGSGRPDADGLRASARAKASLSRLSAERVWTEMKKLLSAKDPGRALLWMRQAGVLTEVLPETEKWGIDTIPALISTETALGWRPDPLLRLAAMVPPDTDRLAAMSARLKMANAETVFFEHWSLAPTVAAKTVDIVLDRLLYREGVSGVVTRLKLALASVRQRAEGDMEALAEAAAFQRLLARAERWKKPAFPLSGADVLKTGVVAGPRVGEILGTLETEWVDSNFNLDRATLVARLEKLVR